MGDKKVFNAIRKVKGINFAIGNAILESLSINGNTLLGELSDADIERLKEAIKSPSKLGLPDWLLNRRKDIETGSDLHLTGMDVSLSVRSDIKLMQEVRSRKGLRHGSNLKVRGQRTKAHPRKGKTVGVVTKKKAAKMQKKPEKKSVAKGGKK